MITIICCGWLAYRDYGSLFCNIRCIIVWLNVSNGYFILSSRLNVYIFLLKSHQITSADLFHFPHSFFHFSSSLWRHKGRIVLGLCYAFSSPIDKQPHFHLDSRGRGGGGGVCKNKNVPLECVANVLKERKKSSPLLSKSH